MKPKDIFTNIYNKRVWSSKETCSGPGSTIYWSAFVKERLELLINALNIQSMLYMPCGDVNFIQHLDAPNIEYTGIDIVDDIIATNQQKFADRKNMHFQTGNAINAPLPQVDLIFCRDLIIHMPNKKIPELIANIKKSNSTWLLISHYSGDVGTFKLNKNITMGDFRPVNLTIAPFDLPEPVFLLPERETNKAMGLWRISDL